MVTIKRKFQKNVIRLFIYLFFATALLPFCELILKIKDLVIYRCYGHRMQVTALE